MGLLHGQDAIYVKNLQPGQDWYAGYVGGLWPDYSPIVARFPNARHKSVAVNASEYADILDVESGDATPAQAPGWFKMMKAAGHVLPGFYASLSVIPAVIAALTAAGISRTEYVLWVAHFTGNPVIEAGGEAEQYADPGPIDLNVAKPSFWPSAPAPTPHINPPHYNWFLTGPFRIGMLNFNERRMVQAYDKLRKHPKRNVGQLWLLRIVLGKLAGRVAREAGAGKPNPTWGQFHRGWRFQQLIHRSQGMRFV